MTTTTRKTAAQKRAEAQAARELEMQHLKAEFAETYESRLLKLVHASMFESEFSVSANSDSFRFLHNSMVTELPLVLSAEYDYYDMTSELAYTEEKLERVKEERRAAAEREQKKSALLARLTKEEKELLGL